MQNPARRNTNVIIRYLTADEPDQSRRALAFLQRVETGEQVVTTCEGVLVEAVPVLSSKRLYNLPRRQVAAALTDVLDLRGLQVAQKPLCRRALGLYGSSNLDFVDALAVAHMEHARLSTIVTFDRDFDGVPGVSRREP